MCIYKWHRITLFIIRANDTSCHHDLWPLVNENVGAQLIAPLHSLSLPTTTYTGDLHGEEGRLRLLTILISRYGVDGCPRMGVYKEEVH
jgi:hypothetical protein